MKFSVFSLGCISLFALVCGIWVSQQYLENPDPLWLDVIHDRNAHLQTGMALAVDIPRGRLGSVIRQLDRSQTWPPLHDGLFVGIALMLGGLDERAAVTPSVIGYFLSIIFAYLLVTKMAGRYGEVGGYFGGYFAAFLVALSPALRAYAADVMLESLGAAFTLMGFWVYLRFLETPDYKRATHLAWVLSALFFLKYNYWLLVLFAFSIHGCWYFRREIFAWIRDQYFQGSFHRWVRQQLCHPVTYILFVMILILMAIHYTKGFTLPIGTNGIAVKSGTNLVTAIWWVFFGRMAIWYWKKGWHELRELTPIALALTRWHIIPVGIWFLWPRRLNTFIWFSNPTANAGERPDFDPLGGYQAYFHFFSEDYLSQSWHIWIVLGLMVLGFIVILAGLIRSGGNPLHQRAFAVLLFLVMCVFLTCQHPNRKSRFLHSWVPMVWVIGGVGISGLARIRYRRFPLGTVACGVGLTAFILSSGEEFQKKPHAQEARSYETNHTALVLSRDYLPKIDPSRQVAIFSNMPLKFFASWTHLQYRQRQQNLETEIRGWQPGAAGDYDSFLNWLRSTNIEQIVYIHVGEKGPIWREIVGPAQLQRYGEYLSQQDRFSLMEEVTYPELDCVVRIYQR